MVITEHDLMDVIVDAAEKYDEISKNDPAAMRKVIEGIPENVLMEIIRRKHIHDELLPQCIDVGLDYLNNKRWDVLARVIQEILHSFGIEAYVEAKENNGRLVFNIKQPE